MAGLLRLAISNGLTRAAPSTRDVLYRAAEDPTAWVAPAGVLPGVDVQPDSSCICTETATWQRGIQRRPGGAHGLATDSDRPISPVHGERRCGRSTARTHAAPEAASCRQPPPAGSGRYGTAAPTARKGSLRPATWPNSRSAGLPDARDNEQHGQRSHGLLREQRQRVRRPRSCFPCNSIADAAPLGACVRSRLRHGDAERRLDRFGRKAKRPTGSDSPT